MFISVTASQKRFNFTKFLLEAKKKNFKNVVFTDESWFELGKNSKCVWANKHQITDKVLQRKGYYFRYL